MKKIIKKICRFIGKIILFIDKILITPIMKLVIRITDFFKTNGKNFEKVITTKSALLIISLLIAFLAFYVIDKNSSYMLNNYAERLYGQEVKAIYNEEAYVVEGLPNTADVILIGRNSDIFLAKQFPSQGITVDLRELSVGTHKVELKYRQSLNFVEYKVDPSYVTVVIHDKVSAIREITYEILHRESLDSKLDISEVKLGKTEVTIKGSEKSIKEVAYVKALIDLNNLVNPEAGVSSVKGVKLVAYNENGNVVNVEILPGTIEAELKLTSSSKMVPIKVVPEGVPALGYAIDTLTPSSNSIMVYGSEESLKDIEYVPVYINVDGLSENKTYNVNVTKPVGVREIGLKTLSVKVVLTEEHQIEVPITTILPENLDPSLAANIDPDDAKNLVAIVKGSKTALDSFDQSTVVATIDFAKYTSPGEYEVEIKVSGEDVKLSYSSKTTKIKVQLYKK